MTMATIAPLRMRSSPVHAPRTPVGRVSMDTFRSATTPYELGAQITNAVTDAAPLASVARHPSGAMSPSLDGVPPVVGTDT